MDYSYAVTRLKDKCDSLVLTELSIRNVLARTEIYESLIRELLEIHGETTLDATKGRHRIACLDMMKKFKGLRFIHNGVLLDVEDPDLKEATNV